MKTKFFWLACLLLMQVAAKAQVKIGDNSTTVNSASLLELETTDKGFVLPRVSITNVNASTPLAAGLLTGTLVYNTNTGIAGGSGVGIYYWDGSKWNFIANTTTTANYWALNGNSGTTASSNFLGTADAIDLVTRTANTERMRILGAANGGSKAGWIGMGISVPRSSLDVTGNYTNKNVFTIQNTSNTGYSSVDMMDDAGVLKGTFGYANSGTSGNFAGRLYFNTYGDDFLLTSNSGTSHFFMKGGTGYIGLNTTTPSERLHLVGNFYLTGAFMPGGNAGTSGYVLTSAGAGASPTWTSASNLGWSLTGNSATSYATNFLGTTDNVSMRFRTNNVQRVIIDSLGRIGIGIGNPSYALSVLSQINPLYLSGVQATTTLSADSVLTINAGIVKKAPYSFLTASSWNLTGNSGTSSANNFIGTTDNISTRFRTNNVQRMIIDSLGRIGIGTNVPSEKLEVLGNMRLSGAFMPNNNSGTTGFFLISSGANNPPTWFDASNYAWQLDGNPLTSIKKFGSTTNYDIPFITNNVERMRLTAAGLLGIGTTNPAYALSVLSASNPLYLSGVQATSTLSTDSVLTINAGVVKKAPYSALNTSWSLTGNSGTNYTTNFLGTTDNTSMRFRTNNTEQVIIDSLGRVGIGASSFGALNPPKLLVDYGNTTSNTIAYFKGNVDTYLQMNLQNTSNSPYASTDYVATADDGTDSTSYIDMGINSSTYATGVENFGGPHDGYLYTNSRNLLIGSTGATSDVIFLLGGGRSRYNAALRMEGSTGNIVIGTGNNQPNATGNIIRAPNGGSGINIPGGSLTLQGGASNGNTAGGNLNLYGGGTVSGTYGSVNINTGINGATNINTGTSTGTVTIGNSLNNINLPKLSASSVLLTDAGQNLTSTTPSNNTYLYYNGTNFTWATAATLGSFSATTPLTYNNATGVFAIDKATTSADGYLSFTDWNTFNNKVGGITLNTPSSLFGTPINFALTSGAATGSLSLNTQTINTVFAGPGSGTASTPTFRTLVAADIPSLGSSYIQNQTTQQALSNFNISGAGTIGTNLAVTGTSTLTGLVTSKAGHTNAGVFTTVGGITNINTSSNFATNINTGTSTGAVTIGNSLNNINLPKLSATSVVLTDASKNLTSTIPSNNTYLYYNGTNFTWATAASGLAALTNGPGIAALNYNGASAATVSLANGTAAGQVYVTGGAAFTPSLVTMNGDATINNTGALILTTVNSNIGTFNNVTVNAKGLVTAASNISYATLDSFSAITPLTYNNATGVFAINKATISADGYLSFTDWNTFNNKVGSITLNTPSSVFTTPINFSVASGAATGTLSLGTQAAGTVFAGPANVVSGTSPAVPTFRALIAGDIPSLGSSYIQNQTTQQALSNFNISGSGTIGTNLAVTGITTLTGLLTSNGGYKNTGAFTTFGGIANINASSNFATNINTGTSTSNITIGNSANNILLPKFSTTGGIFFTSATTGQIANTTTNMNWDDVNSRLGIGLSNPGYKLSILSPSDPLYLSGVQATAAFTTDSVLTIYNGVVKKAPYSSLTGNFWNLTGNSSTNYANNFLGTKDNVSLRFRTNNTERMLIDSVGGVGIGSSAFNTINREKLLVDYGTTTSHTLATLSGSIDDYFQINLQNKSSGTSASTDYVATADDGTETTYYADFGINGSNYAPGVENWGGPHDAYLYSSSRNLLIGTQSANSDVIFLLGGGKIKTNAALRLDAADGNIVVGKGESSTTPVGNVIRGPNGSGANIAGGSLTLQGGSATGTATGGDINISGGTGITGGALILNTSALERMRINALGNIGIGITNPAYKLSVLSLSNPLYLSGVQATTTFTTDSILTINAGIVKKTPYSSLPAGSSGWALTGNSATSAGTNFIGTADAVDFVTKTNATERMRITSAGVVGIGTSTPASDLTIFQSSGSGSSKGFTFTGNSIGGTNTGTGFLMSLGYNSSGNKQLWVGDADYAGNISGSFARFVVTGANFPVLDAVSGDNSLRRYLALGVAGDANSGVIFGNDNTAVNPGSQVWDNGNMAIGSGYKSSSAPSNGLLVQGTVGIGTSTPNINTKLDVAGSFKLGTTGSVLGSVIKSSVTVSPTVNLGTTSTYTATVTGATTGGTVIVNPRSVLASGVVIAYSYVSGANTVTIAFTSGSTTGALGSLTFDVTVIE